MEELTIKEVECDFNDYHAAMSCGAHYVCGEIEKKYGVYGLTPEMVAEEMIDLMDSLKNK